MSNKDRNLKLFTGAALSFMLALQTAAPVYAYAGEDSMPKTEKKDETGNTAGDNSGSQTGKEQETEKVKVILVSADNNKTIAVLEAVPVSGQIRLSDLKMPKGVRPKDKTQKDLKLQDGIIPEIQCITDNKETDLNLTFMDGDTKVDQQSFTQMVQSRDKVSFVQGLNFSLPEGYTLAKDQSEDFEKAWSVSDDAISVPYGKTLSLNVSVVKKAVLNISFTENGKQIGQSVLQTSIEDATLNDQDQIVFDLSTLQAPAGTQFVQTPDTAAVTPGETQNLTIEVADLNPETENKTGQSDTGEAQTPSEDNPSTDQNTSDQSSSQYITANISFVCDGKTVGTQKMSINKNNDGWALSEDVLKLPEGYILDEEAFASERGPYGINDNQNITVLVNKEDDAPQQTLQTQTVTVKFSYVNTDQKTVGESEYSAQITPDQTELTLQENMLAIPARYRLKTMPDTVQISALDQPVIIAVEPNEPDVPAQPLNADLKLIFKTAEGDVVAIQNLSTQLEDGQTTQLLSSDQLQVPNGYELEQDVRDIVFKAGETPEYTIYVKAVNQTPELKQARLNIVFKDKFSGALVLNQTAMQDQKNADDKEASFTLSTFSVPKGYILSNEYKPVSVPYGETKDVTLEVTATGEAVVTFTDGTNQIGESYQYYFEQTEKDQTSAALQAADLSVPNGYELGVDANTTYQVALGTGSPTEISVPVKVKEAQKTALAVLRVQYYILSGSNRQIVSTQTIESPKQGQTDQKYTFDFGKEYKLQVPKGYKLKSNASLGKVDIQYGTMGTIQIEVVRDTAHTSTETNWQLYAGIGAVAIAAAGLLIYFSRKNKK